MRFEVVNQLVMIFPYFVYRTNKQKIPHCRTVPKSGKTKNYILSEQFQNRTMRQIDTIAHKYTTTNFRGLVQVLQ
jgi:hypothetical protein